MGGSKILATINQDKIMVGQVMNILFSLFVVMFASNLRAGPQKIDITVVTQEWVGFTNKDGTGGYWEIIDGALGSKYKIKKKVVPWKRALNDVKNGKADALAGVYKGYDYLLYPKFHIDLDVVDIVYKKDKFPNYKNLKDTKGKKVLWSRGYSQEFKSHFDFPVSILEFNTLEQGLKLLERDRGDFLVDYKTDILPEAKKQKLDMSQYRVRVGFKGDLTYLAFSKKSAKAKQLIADFDAGLEKLRSSGRLLKIYKKWEWDIEFLPYDDLLKK